MDVRTLCLGVLTSGDASGYEIKKLFENGALAHVVDASFGAIYPALARLLEDGLISCREEAQDRRPDKKVYAITAKGREAFRAALMAPLGEDRVRSPFVFAMYFADLLPADRVRALIDTRLEQARTHQAAIQACLDDAKTEAQRFICGLGVHMYDAEIAYIARHRHLIEDDETSKSSPRPKTARPPRARRTAAAGA